VSVGHQTGGAKASQGNGRAGSPYYSHASLNLHVCYCRTSVYMNTPNREVVGHHFALTWTLCTMFTRCKWSWYDSICMSLLLNPDSMYDNYMCQKLGCLTGRKALKQCNVPLQLSRTGLQAHLLAY